MALSNLSCVSQFYPNICIFPKITHQRPALTSFKTNHVCCSLSSNISPPVVERRSANYQPSIWSYEYLQSLKIDHVDSNYNNRAERLEQEIRCVINDADNEGSLSLLQMIDDIQRLGLGHRFEMDIKSALYRFVSLEECNVAQWKSLHATALRFRLLRQHGYEISQDVFKCLKDNEGSFMDCLSMDVEGMVSLYEASFFSFKGEDLMDEALEFTRKHLMNLHDSDACLREEVSKALELPLHRRILRQEAREYIETYGRKTDAIPKLLELAKLDFNIVLATLRSDLQDMLRWWKDIELASKLDFARDRLMECFFWSVGMVPLPQFSNCRKGLTKVTTLITTIDDVYDVYGTLDELELFTNAVHRWDVNAMKNLPDYMKLCFLALYNTVNELAYDTLKDHGQNILPYLTKAWGDLLKAFLVEAKWCQNKRTPTFKNYLKNAWVSVSGILILVHTYFLMTPTIAKQALESLEKNNNIILWPSLVFRLCNDLGTSKAELERGETASSLLCYMNEMGCSEEVAREYMRDLIDESWKKMNEGRVECSSLFDKHFLETAINLARISHFTYQHGDAHGSPDDRCKNRVASLIIEPVSC
ncbi:hypothetical protein SLEP1_g31344 [Rubroshorea leprosula]|uniref:(+)-delta-cadinene synthase n=1 Tax=Rubroshorea leprosula TaxID=152421 RepID=A0AAV5K7X2_9ROSI|nr:hypothetical protein SLEP1_g31344 [Rubroshorea leprosula]